MEFDEIYGQDVRDEYLMKASADKILLVIHSPNVSCSVADINKLLKIDVEENDEIEFVLLEYATLKKALDNFDLLETKINGKFCAYDVWCDGKRVRSTDDP